MMFVAQMLGAIAIFAAIEALESGIRRRVPGLRNRVYSAIKIAYGLPMVLLVGSVLIAYGVLLDPVAILAGVAVASILTLTLFGPGAARPTPDDKEPRP